MQHKPNVNYQLTYSNGAPISIKFGAQVVLPKSYISIKFGTIRSKIEENMSDNQ